MTLDKENDDIAIQAFNLTKQFEDLTAVDHISFHVNKGEIFGIVGPDGAGKTTTLRMLSSIMEPSSGTAAIAGFDTHTQSSLVKEHLAYMSQRFGLYPDLSVSENISFYADLYGVAKKGRQEQIDKLLGFSQMQPFKKRKAKDLSGGMKQKLQLICALVHTPSVLLLDEPTNGVDPVSRRDFWKILYQIAQQGVSILLTTAYLDEAERCDRIGLLDKGQLTAQGTPADIKQLLKGHVLTLRSPDARKINKLLKKKLFGTHVNVFGDTVHIVCEQVEQTKQNALDLIREQNLAADEFKEVPPSLEDIIIDLMEKDQQTPESAPTHISEDYFKPSASAATRNLLHDPNSLQNAVEVKDLTRTFGSFIAVNNLNFKVPKGEIFGFLGPNGAGKSTTIRMLCGLLTPSSGKGSVAGFDIYTQAEQIKQHIGYMSQRFSLYEDLTVEENIHFYGGIYGLDKSHLKKRKEWAMEMANLSGHGKSLTRILSAGWKQRLSLACAILHEPPIVFLDEPTSGVDPLNRRRFWDMIYTMAEQGITIFVTTHYMEEAEYCDRIALIYRGRMIAMGTPAQLKTLQMNKQVEKSTQPVRLPNMEDVFISLIEEDDKNYDKEDRS